MHVLAFDWRGSVKHRLEAAREERNLQLTVFSFVTSNLAKPFNRKHREVGFRRMFKGFCVSSGNRFTLLTVISRREEEDDLQTH
jgi:hypothetical protein